MWIIDAQILIFHQNFNQKFKKKEKRSALKKWKKKISAAPWIFTFGKLLRIFRTSADQRDGKINQSMWCECLVLSRISIELLAFGKKFAFCTVLFVFFLKIHKRFDFFSFSSTVLCFLYGLTALLSLGRLIRFHLQRHPDYYPYAIFYASIIQCLIG